MPGTGVTRVFRTVVVLKSTWKPENVREDQKSSEIALSCEDPAGDKLVRILFTVFTGYGF